MMTRRVIYVWVLFFVGLGVSFAQSQKQPDTFTNYIPSENINLKGGINPNKHRPARRNISYLYKSNSKEVYQGNPCVMEATRAMGFEYVLQVRGIPGSLSDDEIFENNVLVKAKLVFTRSPFWKLILRKKIRACIKQSGDYVG